MTEKSEIVLFLREVGDGRGLALVDADGRVVGGQQSVQYIGDSRGEQEVTVTFKVGPHSAVRLK